MDISGIGKAAIQASNSIAEAVISVSKSQGLDGLKGLFDVTCNGQTQTLPVEELQDTIQGLPTDLGKQLEGVTGGMEAVKDALEQAIGNIR